MKARLGLGLALLLAAASLGGCGKNAGSITSPSGSATGSTGGGAASTDQAEVAAAIAASPEVVEDGQYESPDAAIAEAGPAGSLAAIRPLRWWRTIRSVERTFEFAFADTDSTGRPTVATVTIHKRLNGSFNIATASGDPSLGGEGGPTPPESLTILRKPLEDHWVRRILLHRVRRNDQDPPAWRIVASSGVRVTSRNHTLDIQSLRVQTADKDTTITDPLAFFFLRRIIPVNPGENVTLTLTTNQNDDAVFLMLRDGRRRFTSNGDGTYTGTWRAPLMPGLRHVGADALTHGTLFDDQAPYDAQGWILPFAVRGPAPIAEMLP